MSEPPPSSRLRKSRLIQVLVVYLGASWLVVQVVGELRELLELPAWIGPVTLILLSVGLLIMLATAWVQSHPLVDAREAADEVPGSWELDFRGALQTLKRGHLPHLTWTRALTGGFIAFCLLFGVAGAYVLVRGGGAVMAPREATASEAPEGVAVLPFSVRGAALADWREGMVDLLSTGLDGAAGLRAIASRTVLSRWNELVPDGQADERLALEVAGRTGARYALLGSAVAIGPSVRLVVDVYELGPTGGERLDQALVEGHPDSVLTLVDRLSVGVLEVILQRDPRDLPSIDLASLTTSSLPALKAYLDGEVLFRRGDFERAIAAYERAVAEDTLFALAYHRLGQAYGWNESAGAERGREARARALALVDRLPERQAVLVRGAAATGRFDPEAVDILEPATRKYPDDAEAWYELGDAYLHVDDALGSWRDAERAFERAASLAPRFAAYRIHLLEGAFRQYADSARAARVLAEYERLAPDGAHVERYRTALALGFGDEAAVDSILDDLKGRGPRLGFGPGGPRALALALSHPRLYERRARLAEAVLELSPEMRGALDEITWGRMEERGQLRAGLAELERRNAPPPAARGMKLFPRALGLPVPEDLHRPACESLDVTGPEAAAAAFCAADLGQWERHETALRTMVAAADSALAAGDTASAREWRAEAAVLEGYGAWKHGDPGSAVRLLEEHRVDFPGPPPVWWLGLIHLEEGEGREAIQYFRSLMRWSPNPLASYYLGLAHEQAGEGHLAPPHYQLFVSNWRDADPEFQPLVEDARRRLVALTSEVGS